MNIIWHCVFNCVVFYIKLEVKLTCGEDEGQGLNFTYLYYTYNICLNCFRGDTVTRIEAHLSSNNKSQKCFTISSLNKLIRKSISRFCYALLSTPLCRFIVVTTFSFMENLLLY